MAALRNINIEFGKDHCIGTVLMTDGESIRVVGVTDEEGVTAWAVDAPSGFEATEDFALALVRACNTAIIDEVTK